MNGEAVKEVERLAKEAAGKLLEIDGRWYSTTPLHDPRKAVPEPRPLALHTLASLVAYVDNSGEVLDVLGHVRVHVAGPREVRIVGPLYGEFQQRNVYAVASVSDDAFRFGAWMPVEEMVIALQARFADAGDRAATLKLLGNLRDEHVGTLTDDGVTQTATVRAGVSTAATVNVPNPVQLAPFRTFREVAQPVSPFVLRLQKGRDGPQAALFEADGGAWQLAAIEAVRIWLVDAGISDTEILA